MKEERKLDDSIGEIPQAHFDNYFYPFQFYQLLKKAQKGDISFDELTTAALSWAERVKQKYTEDENA